MKKTDISVAVGFGNRFRASHKREQREHGVDQEAPVQSCIASR